MTKDRAFSLALFIFIAVMFSETYNFTEKSNWEMFSPAFYPRILLGLIFILAIFQAIRSFKTKPVTVKLEQPEQNHGETQKKHFWSEYGTIMTLFIFFGLYVLLLPVLGFILATVLYLFASQGLLMGVRNSKLLAINGLVTLGATVSVYLIFTNILKVWLP